MTVNEENLSSWLTEEIVTFVNNSPENSLRGRRQQKAWDSPLVGFSQGTDSLYQTIKEQIGDFYWTPVNIFYQTFQDLPVEIEKVNVVCWILPQTHRTKKRNRQQDRYASENWVRSRLYGEKFNHLLRQRVVNILTRKGYQALAPAGTNLEKWWEHPAHGYVSRWSERHVAFISGLGTFGLSDGLITPLGMAVRIGSVVTNAPLKPTPRLYSDVHQYCRFYNRDHRCDKCIRRCPAGAITPEGHDKIKCRRYILEVAPEFEKIYHLDERACGLCQTKVPCESRIPGTRD
jgi:epoxyqueuosine reductase